MAVANRLGGLAFGLLEAFFVKFYQYVVDPAPANSWPYHVFLYLAKGPFKCALWPVFCSSAAGTSHQFIEEIPCSFTDHFLCVWDAWGSRWLIDKVPHADHCALFLGGASPWPNLHVGFMPMTLCPVRVLYGPCTGTCRSLLWPQCVTQSPAWMPFKI
jgi:hypothetical protein